VNIVYGPENASGSINSLTNVTLKGTATKMFLGTDAYTVGDTDGNGKTDFIVGSHFQSVSPLTVSGGHYLFTSPPSVLSGDVTTLADATFSGRGSYEYFGLSYSGGDVNGDGLDDILTGTDAGSVVGGGYGEAYLFYGPISGAHTGLTADVLMTGEYPGGTTALSSSIIGDANGDGYEDLVVDAPAGPVERGHAEPRALHRQRLEQRPLERGQVGRRVEAGLQVGQRAGVVGELQSNGSREVLAPPPPPRD
jgi:hypothetical protein